MEKIQITNKYVQVTKIVLIVMFFVMSLPLVVLADDYTYGGNNETYTYGGNSDTYTFGGNSDNYTQGGNNDSYTYGGNSDAYTFGGNNDTYTYGGNSDIYTYGGNSDIYTSGGNSDAYTYGGNNDIYTYGGNSDTYTYGGNSDTYTYGGNSDVYTYGGNSETYTYGGNNDNYDHSIVTSGGYENYGGYYGGGYYYPGSSIVTSGGFSGGVTYITPPTTYIHQPSIVTSGSFSGGNTYITPPVNYVNSSTVTSGSFSTVNPTVTYYTQPAAVPNQVLSYTNTNPGLASIYLSEVPVTGFEDYYRTIIFISILLSWSAVWAYMFLKRKINSQVVLAGAVAGAFEKTETDNFLTSNFMNQIASDNADVNSVEEYARINKVLLSSDASILLVKLSRLGKINASEFIRGVATGEWVAVGENQIK